MILVDTNVLARSLEHAHLHNHAAVASMAHLRVQRREKLVVFPQVLTEFYAIATRATNSLRLTPDQALAEIAAMEQTFSLLLETPQVFANWIGLVSRYKFTNRRVFDLRLVALMQIYGIPEILTFNDRDFPPVAEIQALNPFDVLGIPHV